MRLSDLPTLADQQAQRRAVPKARMVSRPEVKAEKTRKAAAEERACRKAVRVRDRGFCRVCPKRSSHLHHLQLRSQLGKWTTGNIVSLCTRCHQALHAAKLHLSGNPDGQVYWEWLNAPLPQQQKPWGFSWAPTHPRGPGDRITGRVW